MNSNIGLVDRFLRGIIGMLMLGYAVFFHEAPLATLGWLGVIPLATGLLGWCGLYKVLGVSTRKKSTA